MKKRVVIWVALVVLLTTSTASAWWPKVPYLPQTTQDAAEFEILQIPEVGQADPSMTFTIPSAKFADFKAAWLKVYPNNETEDADADPETPETPKYTDNQWLKVSARRHLMSVYRQGKHMLAEESTPDPGIDEGVIVDD